MPMTVDMFSEQFGVDDYESWKPIPFAPRYQVSNFGRVRGIYGGRKLLIHSTNKKGYKQISICAAYGVPAKNYAVHRLVLEAFIGPAPEGHECRHLDGNPSNNYLSNLCWGTPQENIDDRERLGHTWRGSMMPQAKLTEEIVKECRLLYVPGCKVFGTAALAKRFGVHPELMSRAIRGISWAHVKTIAIRKKKRGSPTRRFAAMSASSQTQSTNF